MGDIFVKWPFHPGRCHPQFLLWQIPRSQAFAEPQLTHWQAVVHLSEWGSLFLSGPQFSHL